LPLPLVSRLLPVLLLLLPVGAFFYAAERKSQRELLLPGLTSAGHHQIEGQCERCHTRFGGVKEDACTDCHAAALAAQNDTHAPDKFQDPGRAEMLVHSDARSCLSCHREHRPEARQRGSVSVASTFCFPCHAEIGQQRPDHRTLAPGSCADSGCHNYHDNRALYRDLLLRERDVPALRPTAGDGGPRLPLSSAVPLSGPALSAQQADLTDGVEALAATPAWARSSHAAGGVNCRSCHLPARSGSAAAPAPSSWQVAPATCGTCHPVEHQGFAASKHGMRIAAGLPPMQPRLARLPMKVTAHDATLDCNACHRAHDFDRQEAAVQACEGCHDDRHTRAYRSSPHFALMQGEWTGKGEPGSGVSCASCHLPRRTHQREGQRLVLAVHNQNDNLRPVDRMARDVCMHCHGLGYSLESLADRELVERNFIGSPAAGIRTSMTFVKEEKR
jgi:predicted CXXCH cytochrome family protein